MQAPIWRGTILSWSMRRALCVLTWVFMIKELLAPKNRMHVVGPLNVWRSRRDLVSLPNEK
jgi:cyanate permease